MCSWIIVVDGIAFEIVQNVFGKSMHDGRRHSLKACKILRRVDFAGLNGTLWLESLRICYFVETREEGFHLGSRTSVHGRVVLPSNDAGCGICRKNDCRKG